MSSLKPSPVTTPGQQRRTGQRIIISSASSHGTPPPAGAPAPSYRMDPSSMDSSGVARRGTAGASGTPPPHHHEGGGTVASSARVLPSSAGWGDMEHNKCLAALDALVHSMRSLHDQDDKMASAAAAGIGAAAGVDALHQQEVNELHLITTALHHKDIVGLFSLLTVFWSTRNHVVRDVQALEHRLLCPSGVGIQRPPAHAAGESKAAAAASTTTAAAISSIDVVLADAKRRLDDMSCAIRINVDSATPTTATLHGVVDNDAHDGDGGNTRRPPSLLHHEAIKERCSALEWHRHVLDHGNFADMVALSIDLQQEYQLSQAKLWQPFQAVTTNQQVAQTSGRLGPSLSWQGSVLTDAMLVSAPDASFEERRHYGHGDATSAPLDDGGSNMAAYLAGLRGMVQNALESQGSVQHEVSQLLEAYASKVQDYVAPPVMRLLVPQSLRDGRDVDEDHHEALLPDAAEVHDPLSAVGGASIPLSLSSLPQQQQSTSLNLPGDDASRAVGAMWRLIKFVPLDVAQGESFLQILQRAYGARDGNDARSSGPGMGVRLDQEQLNVRHIFCPVRKCPLVDIPDAWLPPDPRIHTNTNSAVGSSTRTKRYQNLLDAVIRTPMVVAVRVVASLRSVGPAIKALASQTTQLEKDILPTLHRQISDARQQLWDAEIRHIERRTTRKGGDTNDDDGAAASVKRLKDMIVNLEAREAYCHQSLTQCGEHLRALVSGDLAALSAMLTVSTTQVAAGSASVVVAADGSTTTTTWGVPERVVYVCKELPRGADIESFADAFGVAVEDLHVFEDAVACEAAGSVGNAASPSSPRRASLAGGGGGGAATGLVRRTMVYLPMRVPVTNAFEQDLQLTRELEAYAKEYPTFPPNTEILEQLASLRRGDVNTMSALLSASRSKRQALDATSQATALKRKVDDLQQEATTLLRQSDALRRDLRDAESALREKTLALERLEWHHATPTQAPPTTHRSGAASPPQQGETNNDHHDQHGGGGDAYTPDNFIARGLTPWQAVEELVDVAAKKDADILSLQASLKRLQREQEQNTRSAMLRNSSSWRQKQVLEVETVVDGLKNELRDATLRGVELTARCVQLERLNESLKRDVAVAKEERTASCALLQSSQEEMAHLQAALQDAQARAHTAERDATAQAQLHVQRRDTFAAKEIPSGMTPEEFLKFLGVKGVNAELALAKGPVYDALSNTHFLYVPVQVERTSWSHEDLRLQAEIEAAASALIVQTKNKSNRRTVDGGGDAAHGQPVLLHAELLEQLSALRNGDSVALSALIRTYRGKLQEFMLMYGGADAAASGADSPSVGVDSLREEDDLAWSTIKEGRAKVTLLRAALRHADSERMQWKTLCEEYQESETESSTRVASLEEAKHAISQRLSATQLLLESRDKDIASLKERIKGLDDDLQRTQRRLVEAGDRATRDNDVLLEDLKQQLDETRAAHHVAVVALQQRVDHDARTIAALRNALDEMGVELVADD